MRNDELSLRVYAFDRNGRSRETHQQKGGMKIGSEIVKFLRRQML